MDSPFGGPTPKNLKAGLAELHPKIGLAVYAASASLVEHDIRHMLVGGAALAAYGCPRATRDVDFLVGDEAFVTSGIILRFAPGVSLMVGDVPIDSIPINADRDALEEALDDVADDGVPVAPVEVLVLMKLRAGRRKDLGDIIGLIQAGNDPDAAADYLNTHAPELLETFLDLLEEADEEGRR